MLVVIWTLLQIEAVQTYAAKKATTFLSQELKTRVEISKVRFRLLKYLEFEDVYVEDLQSDTLLSVKSLQVDLLNLSFSESNFALAATIDQPIVNLHRHKGDSLFNYQFLIDYFGGDRKSSKSEFVIDSDQLIIVDGRFSYHDYNIPDTNDRMDYSHIDIRELNLESQELLWKGNIIYAVVDNLSLESGNGFSLNKLKAEVEISPEQMVFQDLEIKTKHTDLDADLSFTTHDFKSYNNFVSEVLLSFDFRESLVDLADLAYFVPSMSEAHHQISLDGKVNGTIGNLRSDKIALTLNRDSYLIGEFDIRGLPDIEETFIFFEASRLSFNASTLNNLPINSFKSDLKVTIPKSIERLGQVNFEGNFSGYVDDFVAYGDFSTELGNFNTDIALSQEAGKYYYDGSLSAEAFDLGGLLAQEDLGNISMNLDLDGEGLEIDAIRAKAIGDISSLAYKDYNYNNIKLNGAFSAKKFNGELSIRDEFIALDFVGTINADTAKLVSKFKLDVSDANLAMLKLFNREDSLTKLSFQANFDIVGGKLDDFNGGLTIDSIDYQDARSQYRGNNIQLSAKRKGEKRYIELNSSFLDAKLDGKLNLNDLVNYLEAELLKELPFQKFEGQKLEGQQFSYDFYFKKFKPISQIFLAELEIDSSSRIKGFFNDSSGINRFEFSSPHLAYKRWQLHQMNFSIRTDEDGITSDLQSEYLEVANNLRMRNFQNSNHLEQGKANATFIWEGINENTENGRLNLRSKIDSLDGLDIYVLDSYFFLNDSLWSFNSSNEVHLRGKSLRFDSLQLGNANQSISLNGKLSKDPLDSLHLDLKDFNLSYLSTFIDSDALEMKGRINGKAVLKDPYGQRVITSDLLVSQLELNQLKIDEAALQSYWLRDSSGIAINAYIGKEQSPLVAAKGTIDPRSNRDNLNLQLQFNDFPIMVTEPFIDHVLSDLEGELSGKIAVKGKLDKPFLRGKLQLQDAFLHVNYLNTDYRINHSILIRPDFIGFDLMDIKDKNGNIATATGTIFHQNYSEFNLDIGIEMKDFLALNTTEADNELFFGTAVTSGWSNISGYADQLIFEMNLTAKDGTDFNIPLKDDVSLSENDFLVFTNSPQYDEDSTIQVDLSGIQLNFDLKIEPEAKVSILFDPSIGDAITARGVGNLKLEINTLGNFNMFGQYELEQGEYLFTLRNIVNKRFQLTQGSKMMWDGDPYQARLDIQAIYNVRASLYDLMPEDSTGRYRRRVPVELILNLGGYLLNPEIGFDIKIPGADEVVSSRLQSILYVNESSVNEQELNQQVFGLLVLNRFMPPSSGSNESTASRGAPGMNNAYELLSNQLSSWLSSVSNEFDVGVSYRPGDEVAQEELDVSLSTEILNDRLVLDGNFGYVADNENYTDERASNFIGEFMVEYKLKRDGRLRVRGFNRSNNNDLLQLNSQYTQGVGLFYREDFNSFSELWRKYFRGELESKEKDEEKEKPKEESKKEKARLKEKQEEEAQLKEQEQ